MFMTMCCQTGYDYLIQEEYYFLISIQFRQQVKTKGKTLHLYSLAAEVFTHACMQSTGCFEDASDLSYTNE